MGKRPSIFQIAPLAVHEALIENGDAKDARIQQLESEVAMLREELRIIGARMKRVPPQRRPQYTAVERMAIIICSTVSSTICLNGFSSGDQCLLLSTQSPEINRNKWPSLSGGMRITGPHPSHFPRSVYSPVCGSRVSLSQAAVPLREILALGN